MGIPILNSSDLPIVGEKRYSRKWVNKIEGPKILPTNKNKGFKIALNREPNTKLIQKHNLPSTVLESQFRNKKNSTAHQNKDTQSVPTS